MKWEGQRQSENVEDARGSGGGRGGIGLPIGGRGIGIGGIAIALIASWVLGINPLTLLGVMDGGGPAVQQQAPAGDSQSQDPAYVFAKNVLGSTEDVWTAYFQRSGQTYEMPRLRVFRGQQPTACGTGDAAMGPFYCPGDRKVYIDLGFYDTLRERLGAPGDFAQAYVIAHEVGHHLQNLMGTTAKLDQARGRVSEREMNAMSVKLELQADCYAGVWANLSQQTKGWKLEQGDVEEALNAATQIGDDTLQKRSRGTVVPESFTHGSSAQRVRWFRRGLEAGDLKACDTFGAAQL
ncbi:MAG: metalloprotease [Rubrivivax sp.]|nr:MAG: metalloprotease [Rubrivivax sp.]